MKYLNRLFCIITNQHLLFHLFLFVLIVPNLFLAFTEGMSVLANVCNIVMPLACYWLVMTLSPKPGKMLWVLFLFLFFGAFQLVLLYLFGEAIIAVDMFINLATTNSNEAMELLNNLTPAIIGVCLLYLPTLALATYSIYQKKSLSASFRKQERYFAGIALLVGGLLVGTAYQVEPGYRVEKEMYPLNVCYNVILAAQRNYQTKHYPETSANFTFEAQATHPKEEKEIHVLVIGETARALNWGLYGYERNTTPLLEKREGLIAFTDALTQSNTTHKSVPILLSAASAENFNCLYSQKSVVTAFREAGFYTAFFSNQRPNYSFIDFFGQEADTCHFIKEESSDPQFNPEDNRLLDLVEQAIGQSSGKLFIVLHTYGSHFNYRERYPANQAVFLPDNIVSVEKKYRNNLLNAYDNTILYTDRFLDKLITLLDRKEVSSSMLYISDHGEDILDDDRNSFLHASPVPSYYQLHIPYIIWMSEEYRNNHPTLLQAAKQNRQKAISSNSAFHTQLNLGGVQTSYRKDSLSVVSPHFTEKERLYLNDHNHPISLKETKIKESDFEMFRLMGIRY